MVGEYMTRLETMAYLKCSEQTLYNMANIGILKKDGKGFDDDSIYELTGHAEEVFKVPEMAMKLGVSEQTIYNKINNGELKSFKVGVGAGRGGVRIVDAEAKQKAKKENKATKKSDKIVVKRINSDGVEVIISVQGNHKASDTKLIKDYVRAWIDTSNLEENLSKLRELI